MFDSVKRRIDRLEIPFNRYGVDPYGVSQKHLRVFFSALSPFYHRYFSVECRGIAHIPARGRAMIVGNHSGGWAVDGLMVIASAFWECEPPRLAQGMAEKFISRTPIASMWAARTGQLPGLPEHAERLLEDERLLMVFPEGARGTAKLYRDRYSLVDFGTGFMRLALKTKTPIVPFGFLGGGEAVPTVYNATTLGRALGVPYIPLTPYGIPFPLPAKLEVEYAPPMLFEGTGNEEDEVVLGYVERVKSVIAEILERGRVRRRHGEFARLPGVK